MIPVHLHPARFPFSDSPAASPRRARQPDGAPGRHDSSRRSRSERATLRPSARRRPRRAAVHRSLAPRRTPLPRTTLCALTSEFFVRTAAPASLPPADSWPCASPGASQRRRSTCASAISNRHHARAASADRVFRQRRPDQLRVDEHRRLGRRSARRGARSRAAAGGALARARVGRGRRHPAVADVGRPARAGSSRATSCGARSSRSA